MTCISRNRILFAGLISVLTFSITIPQAQAIQNAENQDVRALLNKAADQASALDYDADQMTGLLRNDISWQDHVVLLNEVKEHVNVLGRTIAKLQAERSEGNTLQQEAIDRAVPLLQEVAQNTTDAIEHLNRNHIRPVSGDYPEYLDQNAETAHDLSRLINATVDYSHQRSKLQRLQKEIEIASK
jgi:hypothetical protein